MALEGELVLLLAPDLPAACHLFAVLAHGHAGARFAAAGQRRFEMPRSEVKPGLDALTEAARAETPEHQLLVAARKHGRRVADGIHAARDAGIDLSERDLVADQDRSLETRAAGTLQVESRSLRRKSRAEHRFTREIPLARMLGRRAGDDVAEPLAAQRIAVDDGRKRRRQQFLVAGRGVGALPP